MKITFDDLIDKRDTINLNYRSVYTSKAISRSGHGSIDGSMINRPNQKYENSKYNNTVRMCGKVATELSLCPVRYIGTYAKIAGPI